jgi:hypothetical protein
LRQVPALLSRRPFGGFGGGGDGRCVGGLGSQGSQHARVTAEPGPTSTHARRRRKTPGFSSPVPGKAKWPHYGKEERRETPGSIEPRPRKAKCPHIHATGQLPTQAGHGAPRRAPFSSSGAERVGPPAATSAPPPATTNIVPYYYIAWRPTGTPYLALAVYCAGCL